MTTLKMAVLQYHCPKVPIIDSFSYIYITRHSLVTQLQCGDIFDTLLHSVQNQGHLLCPYITK